MTLSLRLAYAENVGFATLGVHLYKNGLHLTIDAPTPSEGTENTNPLSAQDTMEDKKTVAAKLGPTAFIPNNIEFMEEETGVHTVLDVALWYPTPQSPKTITIGAWSLQAALNAKPSEGFFPLIILSHATGESRFSHHPLASFLAKNGFVVAALTHPHDCHTDTSSLFTLQQLVERPQHISTLIDALANNTVSRAIIDTKRIAVIGFGVGATTALTLAGAIPDPKPWTSYCKQASPSDIYCGPWAKKRLDTLALALEDALIPQKEYTPHVPAMPILTDHRIRAFALMTPAYGMFFPASALSAVQAPILLAQAEHDEINQTPFHADALRKALPHAPEFLYLNDANHFSLRAKPDSPANNYPNTLSMAEKGRNPQKTHSAKQSQKLHEQCNTQLVRFLQKHLMP